MKKFIFPLATTLLTGCATELSPAASQVQIITAEQKTNCKFLGMVATDQRLGPDKQNNAMRKAYNEAATRGANSIYIITSSLDWAEGASVTAEAYNCPSK
jgi:hypothetical protein